MTRAILRLAIVAVGVATAVWLLPASAHIVNWPPGGPARVALLAPLRTLWICLASAAAFVIGVAIAGARGRPRLVEQLAVVLGPFALVWLWTLPYLPWLPDRAPLLLVLAGPLRWGIFGIAGLGTLCSLAASRNWVFGVRLPGRWTAFSLALCAYLMFGLWSARQVGPAGDEPHYLTITQSLLRDRDLDI